MKPKNEDKLIQWNLESLRNQHQNKPLAIVATGPSFSLLDRTSLQGCHVFALNAAITELHNHSDGLHWVCHDFHKIFRHDLRGRIGSYEEWDLITRRVNIPGHFGNVPWRGVGGGQVRHRFPHPMKAQDLARSTVYWYNELKKQEGFLLAEEGVLEIALEVATFWGFSPIVLVGVDMGAVVDGLLYAKRFRWKKCHIKPGKFAAMKNALIKKRGRWAQEIFTLSPYWSGKFEPISQEEWIQKLGHES